MFHWYLKKRPVKKKKPGHFYAPCGHEGEPIIGQYVKCKEGCDSKAVPKHIDSEITEKIFVPRCPHHHTTVQRHGNQVGLWCDDCGRFLRYI